MTQTISEPSGARTMSDGAPRHCGEPMTLRETSYRGSAYGMIQQPTPGSDVELVWACTCGFQLSPEEPAELAYPLPPALHRVAAAAADLESMQWHLDRLAADLEAAVVRATDAGAALLDVAEAAQLDPADVQHLASGVHRLADVG